MARRKEKDLDEGKQYWILFPVADKRLLENQTLTAEQVWDRLSDQGKKVINMMVRASAKALRDHQDRTIAWMKKKYETNADGTFAYEDGRLVKRKETKCGSRR